MRNYRDLEVWKISHKLTLELYAASKKFPKDEMFGLTSQLRRAAVSIGANLAEGCGLERALNLRGSFGFRWAQQVNLITICCFVAISDL